MPPFYYRIIRALNRYTTFTPEFQKKVSREEFIRSAEAYLGYPYILWGDGSTRESGIDCSHLIARALIDTGAMHPAFYRTARHLRNLTTPLEPWVEILAWDLLFLWDDTGNIGHVAIILDRLWEHSVTILDASGPSTGIWSTTIREIQLGNEKFFIGTPSFLI